MSGKKLSGAQGRKRKHQLEESAEKSSQWMKQFLKQGKKHELHANFESDDQAGIAVAVDSNFVDQNQNDEFHEPSEAITQQNNEQESQGGSADKINLIKTVDEDNASNTIIDSQSNRDDDDNNVTTTTTTPAVLTCGDIGYLKFDQKSQRAKIKISENLHTELVCRGPSAFQNKNGPFVVRDGRSMNTSWFTRRLANRDEINRSWLLYSPFKKSAYCFCCLLFPSKLNYNESGLVLAKGFSNWKKPEKISAHETNSKHRESFTAWKEADRRILNGKGIDAELQAQIQTEKQRWRDVLKRILSCIKFLAFQNLALRGHKESLEAGEVSNVGNFLAVLKLVAQYDPLLSSHMEHARKNPGSVSYLSPIIQNEFISLLASKVREKLLNDIKRNKYYGILFDSTPDVAHREQLSQVIRYVDVDFVNKAITVKESFLGFIELHAKDAATLEKVIVDSLESNNLPLADCRSQCYDNAAIMAGHISGLQQRISARNHRALFVNCNNHSLNLAGVHSAGQDVVAVTFFGTIGSIYLYFSHSTLRWEELKNVISNTVKRESETRWSARVEAVNAVHDGVNEIVGLLEKLSDDNSQTHDTKTYAGRLLANILNFNFLVLLHFWHKILGKIDHVQKRLQDPMMNLKKAASDLESLETELNEIRDKLCQEAIQKAKEMCNNWGIAVERRIRRRKQMAQHVGLSAEEEINCIMKSIFDRFQKELTTRFTQLQDLNLKFDFLLNIKDLLTKEIDKDVLYKNCLDFAIFYDSNVNGMELYNEICDSRMLLTTRSDTLLSTPLDLITFLGSHGEDVFPNLRIALQILMIIAVSIASFELLSAN